MPNPLHVKLHTPNATYFDGQADSVFLQTKDGQLEIFPDHAPLAGVIDLSLTKIRVGNESHDFALRQGMVFMHTQDNRLDILAQICEKSGEINYMSIKEYMETILSQLSNPQSMNKYQMNFLENQKLATEKLMEVIKPDQTS